MIIGGVDLGGRKASLSIFTDGELTNVADLEVPKLSRARELRTLAFWAWTHLKVCDSVVVEEPLIGRGVRASLQIAQTAGAVLSELAADVDHIDFVPVTSWKKEVVGKGTVNKDEVRLWLQSNHPRYATECGSSQDRIDAVCIGLYGQRIHDRAAKLEEL